MVFATLVLSVHIFMIPAIASLFDPRTLLSPRNLPLLAYGTGVYVFLVVGLPLSDPVFHSILPKYLAIAFLFIMPLWVVPLITRYPTTVSTSATILHWYDRRYPGATWRVVLALGWIICIGVALNYFLQFGTPPLLDILRLQSSADLYALRKEVTYTIHFNRHSMFFYSVPPVLVALAWTLYRSDLLSRNGAYVSLLLGAILAVSFLHKTPLVVVLLVVAGVDYNYGYMSVRRVFAYGAGGLMLMLVGYIVYMKGYSLEWIIGSLLRRLTTPYVESTFFVLDEIPRSWPFFWGTTFPNPRGIIPIESVNLSAFVMEQYGGRIGAKPVPSIVEGYANFGWVGAMLLSGLITGWLTFLRFTHQWAVRTPLAFAVWVVLSVSCYKLAAQGFFAAIDLRLLAAVSVLLGLALLVEGWVTDMWGRSRNPGLLGSDPSGQLCASLHEKH